MDQSDLQHYLVWTAVTLSSYATDSYRPEMYFCLLSNNDYDRGIHGPKMFLCTFRKHFFLSLFFLFFLVVKFFHLFQWFLAPEAKVIICVFFTNIGDIFSYTVKKNEKYYILVL